MNARSPSSGPAVDWSLSFFASGEGRGDKYRLLFDAARFADTQGLRGIWVPERHFTPLGGLFPQPSLLLAALARETRNLRLGAGSIVVPLHHPVRVAEELAVVDNLSGGRVVASFASGWHPGDFTLAPEAYEDRRRVMLQGVETVRRLWSGQPVSLPGGDGLDHEVRIFPTPLQRTLPTWLTSTGSAATFETAGAMGTNVLTHLVDQDLEVLAGRIAAYRRGRQRVGLPEDGGTVTVMLHTFLGEDETRVRAQARPAFRRYLLANAPLLQASAHSRGRAMDLSLLTEGDIEALVDHQFERLFSGHALLGTPQKCVPLVRSLTALGVGEIACLVDFVDEPGEVLEGLHSLLRLRELCAAPPRSRPAPLTAPPIQAPPAAPSLEALRSRAEEVLAGETFYARLLKAGGDHGPGFRLITRLWRSADEALAELELPASLRADLGRYPAHPALLDSCFVVLIATALAGDAEAGAGQVGLPAGMRGFRLLGELSRARYSRAVRVREAEDGNSLVGNVAILDADGAVIAEATGLRIQGLGKKRAAAAPTVGAYTLRWEPTTPLEARPASGGPWLVLDSGSELGGPLVAALQERGASRAQVIPEVIGHDARVIEHQVREALTAGPAGTVVFLWEAGERSGSVDPGVLGHKLAVLAAAARGAAHPGSGGARLVVVTSGALAVQGPPTAPEAATAWGLARTLFAEHPSLAGGLIDLEREPVTDRSVLLLVTALLAPERELEVAFRRGRGYVPRLEAAELPPAPALPAYRADASYLILGGMGALGLAVAGHLAARGAGALILLQRTPLSDMEQGPDPRSQRRAVEALEQAGARVAVVPADISDARSVARALEELRRRGWPPVKGVVHAAGVLHDGTLARLDADAFTRVLAPKVSGAWLVHRALGDTPLDFFVLFSSVASITGAPGQGNYAAANAFLDSLAPALVAAGRPAVSISWGPWADIGMTARTSRSGMALRSGRGLEVEAALGAFERLRSGALGAHVAVLSFDWGRLGEVVPAFASRPVFSRLVPGPAAPARGLDKAKLRAGPPAGARRMLEQYLCANVANLLGLKLGEVEPDRALTGMGFDSLSALQLRNTVDAELGVVLPMEGLLEQTTIRNLATSVLLALPEEQRVDGAESFAEVEP